LLVMSVPLMAAKDQAAMAMDKGMMQGGTTPYGMMQGGMMNMPMMRDHFNAMQKQMQEMSTDAGVETRMKQMQAHMQDMQTHMGTMQHMMEKMYGDDGQDGMHKSEKMEKKKDK